MVEEAKDTFIIRTEWHDAISELKEADQLLVYNNLFAYHKGGTVNLPNLNTKLVWKLIEPTLKSNIVKWDKRKQTSAANGVLGGRPRGTVHVEIPKEEEQQQAASDETKPKNLNKPTGFEENKPNNLLEKPNILNNPVSVFVSDTVNDNEVSNNTGETPVEKEKILYWHKLVAAWQDFYGQRFFDEQKQPRKPLFKKKHAGQLAFIIKELKKIAKGVGREWTEPYAEYMIRGFFQKAWLHDDWLKKNFELGNMISKFDSIISTNGSDKGDIKTGNGTNHGKSTGAIKLAQSLADDLRILKQ